MGKNIGTIRDEKRNGTKCKPILHMIDHHYLLREQKKVVKIGMSDEWKE